MHKFKKSLGQNFLQDKNILKKIGVSLADISDKTVVEIGTGQGALTDILKDLSKRVITFEVDNSLKEYLTNKYQDSNVEVIFSDYLEYDISRLSLDKPVVIANIPYYITTPIIIKNIEFLSESPQVYLVQKELRERFSAKPGSKEYGRITVILNYFYEIEFLFNVKKESFFPAPKVDSSVIMFTPKDKKPLKNINFFLQLVKDSFQFKRKTIKNNLANYDLDVVEKVLKKYNYDLSVRSEDLDYSVFVDLANELYSID